MVAMVANQAVQASRVDRGGNGNGFLTPRPGPTPSPTRTPTPGPTGSTTRSPTPRPTRLPCTAKANETETMVAGPVLQSADDYANCLGAGGTWNVSHAHGMNVALV